MDSNNSHFSELEGSERPTQASLGFHPLLGLDDRAVAKGLQRNDAFNNINAFTEQLRTRDESYYSNMPMNTIETDPGNTNKDKEATEKLRQILQTRVVELNSVPVVPKEEPATLPEKPLVPVTGWSGFWYDLKHWNKLPTKTGWRRFHYIVTRDNRLRWFILFVIVVMILGYIFHM